MPTAATVDERERLFARLTQQLSEALSLDETIDVMLRAIVPDFADWMSVYLEKHDGEGFEVIAMRHWDEARQPIVDELLGTSFATESSATAQVLRTGKSVLLERYPEELRRRSITTKYAQHLQTLGLRSAIVVPFRRRGKVIGAFHVIRGDNPVDFDSADLALVEELAARLTPAIYNAEVYERERLVARRFQEAALPTSFPDVAGLEFDAVYEAAITEGTVGGDWYDVFHIDDERLLVSVGDVAGHGLRAATIMMMLRQSLRALSLTTASAGDLMYLLRLLLAREYPDVLATAFIGILWPANGKFVYVSAGHPAPLLRSADGRVRELVGGRRPLLGVAVTNPVEAVEIVLEPGSLVVLFTDGLTEATRDVIEGERKLHEVVASAEVGCAAQPAHVVYDRMRTAGSFDDTAVLSMRYVPV
jgi:Stage II sporulation protein E (SpoIIE)/GAF domain